MRAVVIIIMVCIFVTCFAFINSFNDKKVDFATDYIKDTWLWEMDVSSELEFNTLRACDPLIHEKHRILPTLFFNNHENLKLVLSKEKIISEFQFPKVEHTVPYVTNKQKLDTENFVLIDFAICEEYFYFSEEKLITNKFSKITDKESTIYFQNKIPLESFISSIKQSSVLNTGLFRIIYHVNGFAEEIYFNNLYQPSDNETTQLIRKLVLKPFYANISSEFNLVNKQTTALIDSYFQYYHSKQLRSQVLNEISKLERWFLKARLAYLNMYL